MVATSAVRVPDGPLDPVVLLRDTAQEVLQEIQDLVVTSVRVVWPDPAAHAVSEWDEDGRLHLGYHPAGEVARPAVLTLPPYSPLVGPPRIAG